MAILIRLYNEESEAFVSVGLQYEYNALPADCRGPVQDLHHNVLAEPDLHRSLLAGPELLSTCT